MSPRSVSRSTPSSDLPERVLAIDPGREKTGLAIVASDGACLHRAIVPTATLREAAASLAERFAVTTLLLGDRTHAAEATGALADLPGLTLHAVDEHRSTEEARRLYLRENPARGLARLLPIGMRTPPGPIDDYAAWVLGRRYYGLGG
jgi:hypothetical protein